ncbi:MAG: hypothetical protein H6984_05455 [Pseudomonadales bacterium]|nr:hypothetical protein [Halioglobus sp.]MCP5121894.1 hypothetical protein [Pseudomonadales bacterium]MCP5192567.1 hypothetical protein [Pseudomonadales bacterium]
MDTGWSYPINYLLLFFALLQFALLVRTFSRGFSAPATLWLLRFLLLGMCYDNLVQGSGNWFIDAPWYAAANVPRFVLHASVLPFLTLFGLSVMRAAGVALARKPMVVGFCWLFTLAALGWGLYHEVYLLQLGPRPALGVMKLGSVSSLPPVATILTSALALPIAAAVWKASGWQWFFLGALLIFVVNGATGARPWGFLAGNCAELVFIVSLLATERRFRPAHHR